MTDETITDFTVTLTHGEGLMLMQSLNLLADVALRQQGPDSLTAMTVIDALAEKITVARFGEAEAARINAVADAEAKQVLMERFDLPEDEVDAIAAKARAERAAAREGGRR